METQNREIEYLGQKVKVLQYLSESNYVFKKKLEYIKKLEEKKIEWKEANRLSKIWYCEKFKNCEYKSL